MYLAKGNGRNQVVVDEAVGVNRGPEPVTGRSEFS
jgi:hypothetical protein